MCDITAFHICGIRARHGRRCLDLSPTGDPGKSRAQPEPKPGVCQEMLMITVIESGPQSESREIDESLFTYIFIFYIFTPGLEPVPE